MSYKREVIQFVPKTKYIHCSSLRLAHDDTAFYIETGTGPDRSNRLMLEIHPSAEDVRFFFDTYDGISHECRFVNRILCCPSCRRAESFCDRTGYLLHKMQLEDTARDDAAWSELHSIHPMVIWPCERCFGNDYRFNHAQTFVEDCLRPSTGEYRNSSEVCKLMGIRQDLFNSFVANGCPATTINGSECVVHVGGFAAWLADVWKRRIDQFLIRWRTPITIIEAPEDACSLVGNAFRCVTIQSTEPGVYLLLQGNEVVYVGQSKCVAKRITSHFEDKKFDRAVYRPVSTDRLLAEERRYIDEFDPLYNRDLGTAARRSRESRITENCVWRSN